MKKVFVVSASLFFVIVTANAQTEKQKEPPPPPPKPKEEVKYKVAKDEKEKVDPPKIVYAKPKLKEPPPPSPKLKEEIKYKVVKDEKPKEPVITVSGKLADEFYQKNPSVSEISREGNIITLKMKDGTIEKYDTSKKDEDKSFTDKYGKSPIPPPPPPKLIPKQKTRA